MSKTTQKIWEDRYRRGDLGARYPFDFVVGFVLRKFSEDKRLGINVLDFGCGVGNHLKFFIENGFETYGLESSQTALEIARERLKSEGIELLDQRLFLSENKNRFPFSDDMFDLVLDRSSVGQNSAVAIRQIISEIYRTLKPGGVYLGINFSDLHPDLVYGRSLGDGDFDSFSEGKFYGLGSRHFFNVTEVKDLFKDFNIEDIRILSNKSIYGIGGSEELIVVAERPID